MTSPDKTTKSDASEPDLASLDAAWEDEEAEEEEEGSSDDVDDAWETVPDPKGGPPQRRRLSPKERARQKREKQRLKADAAAQKQKKKKPRSARGRDEAEGDEERAPAEAKPKAKASPRAPVKRKTFDAKTIAMIAAALVVAAVALYFMLTSRR